MWRFYFLQIYSFQNTPNICKMLPYYSLSEQPITCYYVPAAVDRNIH